MGSHLIYRAKQKQSHILIYQQTRIKVDIPDAMGKVGLTSTGHFCEQLLKDHRHISVSLVPDRFQPVLCEFLNRLRIILYIYTSQNKDDQVNTVLYKEFCIDTYKLLLNNFENLERK